MGPPRRHTKLLVQRSSPDPSYLGYVELRRFVLPNRPNHFLVLCVRKHMDLRVRYIFCYNWCKLGCLYLIQVRVGFQAASPLAWPGRSTRTNTPGDPVFGAGVLNKRRPRRARANCSRSSRKFSNVLLPRKVHTVRSFRVVALRAACQPACKAPAAQQVVVRTSVLWAVRRPSRRLPVRPGGRPQHSKSVRAAALRAACQSARKATKSAASRLRISVPQGCSPPVAPLVSPPRRAPAWRHNVPDCRGYRCVSRKHRTRSVSSAM